MIRADLTGSTKTYDIDFAQADLSNFVCKNFRIPCNLSHFLLLNNAMLPNGTRGRAPPPLLSNEQPQCN